MQPIKNGIKTTLRTPGKALLFAVILTVLSALVSVASGVFSAVRGYISDADGYFHTVAELEFMGEHYPTRNEFEPGLPAAIEENASALDALLSHDAVISFTPASNTAALAEELMRRDGNVAMPNAAVCALYITDYNERYNVYSALVSKTYYSAKDYTEKLVELTVHYGMVGKLESGKKYLMSGTFTNGHGAIGNRVTGFFQQNVDFIVNGEAYTTPDFELIESYDIPDDNVFMLLANHWNRINNACRVTYTEAIEDELPFHQQQIKLQSGRLFTEDEYKNNSKVVILSENISYNAGQKKVGDRIKLSVFDFSGDLADGEFTERDEDEYEIVGIFPDDSAYPSQIYMPGAPGEGIRAVTGSSLGQFRLKNDRAAAFLTESEKLSEAGFRVSVYDQGYRAATEPMRELKLISLIFLAVCILLAAVALVLQSHVFVSRQAEAAQTMYSLGASKIHIMLYFLSGALLLAMIGALAGILIAKSIEGRVFELMQRFSAQFNESDTRFSVSRLALVRTLEFSPKIEPKTYLVAVGALVLSAAVSTLAFAFSALREKRRAERVRAKKHSSTAKTEPVSASRRSFGGKTSRLSGRLKYALLSIKRSPMRTLAILLLAASAAVFFSRLTASLEGYHAQLEAYKRDAVIRGSATDMYGRNIEGFLFGEEPIRQLVKSGEMKDLNLTIDLGYMSIMGIAITKDGTENRAIPYNYPYLEISREMLISRLRRDLKWISSSTVSNSPTFRFKSVKDIRFLEGYSERDFMRIQPVCAMSESVMNSHGIELGDAVMFQVIERNLYDGKWSIGRIILKVVAAYSSNSTQKTVFSPLNQYYPVMEDPFDPTNPDNPFEKYYNYYEEAEGGAEDDGVGTDEVIAWRLDANGSDDEGGEEETEPPQLVDEYGNPVETLIIDGVEVKIDQYEVTVLPSKYSSFMFTLKDANRLDEARDALEKAGYAPVGTYERTKPYVVIDDEMYLNTVRSMQRQIQYVSVLYYALYAIAGIIGFALAWLLSVSRRMEIALMRALGTPNLRIIANFFFEHALLCLLGLGIGLLIMQLAFGAPLMLCLMLSAAFFALWCAATLICLVLGLAKSAPAEEKE